MNSSDDPGRDAEAARVGRIYARYGASRRRRRAWAADNPGNIAIREELLERLRDAARDPLRGPDPVLDAGCGLGHWLRTLAGIGVDPARLHGIDILNDRLAAAEVPPGVELQQADVRALPYPDDHFSLVLLFTVLSSLGSRADIGQALREARRVTRPAGIVLIYEPRIPQPFNHDTIRVRSAEIRAALGTQVAVQTLTALPPLARVLGPATPRIYPLIAAVPALRTHRLVTYTRPWAGL